MAKHFGAKVIITAGSDDKCAACRDLSADLTINYNGRDFVEACRDFTDGAGVNVILDMVGGDYIAQYGSRSDGRAHRQYCLYARVFSGSEFSARHVETADFDRLNLAGASFAEKPA